MKRVSVFVAFLAAVAFMAHPMAQAAKPAAGQGRLIEIEATDQMKFSVTTITAKPGELLHVRLKAVGTMPKIASAHNFVLLKAGVDALAFANDSIMAGAPANYIAASKKNQVIASTPQLVGAGETSDVTFKAPAAGTYTYICSFPGHFASGMKGTLTVK
jgi:azurin